MADILPRPYIRTARADRRLLAGVGMAVTHGRTAQVEGSRGPYFHVRAMMRCETKQIWGNNHHSTVPKTHINRRNICSLEGNHFARVHHQKQCSSITKNSHRDRYLIDEHECHMQVPVHVYVYPTAQRYRVGTCNRGQHEIARTCSFSSGNYQSKILVDFAITLETRQETSSQSHRCSHVA
jgi:hypothetical protein